MRGILKKLGFIHDIVFYVISFGILCATGTTGNLLAAPPESTNEVSKPDTIQQQIETNDYSALRISVIICGYAHSNRFIGPEKYISGMPVILSVDMKNPAARDGVEGAVPVKVPGNWREMFVFSVVDKEGVLRPDLSPRLARQQARSKREEPVEVFKNELHDDWLIDSSTTAQLKGEYRLTTAWKNVRSRDREFQFREQNNDEDRAIVFLYQAGAQILRKDFGKAIHLLEEVVKLRGENFEDGDTSVLDLLGEALVGANRPKEALNVYKKALTNFYQRYPDDYPEVTLMQIGALERQLSAPKEKPRENEESP